MELRIEKINVSDDKFLVTTLYVQNGQKVCKGDLIYSVESSKAAQDIEAPCDGYVYFADGVEEFNEYPANFLLAQIVETEENPFEKEAQEMVKETTVEKKKEETNEDVVVTEEAQQLLNRYGINSNDIRRDFISKWDVLSYIKGLDQGNSGYYNSIKRVAVIGAGRGAIQVLDLIENLVDYKAVMLFDDTPEKRQISLYGVPVVGPVDYDFIASQHKLGLFDYVVNSVSTSVDFRKNCYEELVKREVPFCNLIHPSVVIGHNVSIGTGNIIYPQTHIGPNVIMGNDNYITAKASIEHHNILGSHCTFGPGVMMSGSVTIGDCVKFGAGIFVEPYVEIGSNALIASGVILTQKIPENVIVRNKAQIEIVQKKINK
ncbi:MAG: hypothetical protein KBF13_00090 [Prevotella sp.]|nr:hypothetical protein [Prevotella sp.]